MDDNLEVVEIDDLPTVAIKETIPYNHTGCFKLVWVRIENVFERSLKVIRAKWDHDNDG